MKKLLLAACAVLALSVPAYAVTIAQGQADHAADKAAGYSFVTSGDLSVGTLVTKGVINNGSSTVHNGIQQPDRDGMRCVNSAGHTVISINGFFDSPFPDTCNARQVTYDEFRGSGGYFTQTCSVSTHSYFFDRGAVARTEAVKETQTAGKC